MKDPLSDRYAHLKLRTADSAADSAADSERTGQVLRGNPANRGSRPGDTSGAAASTRDPGRPDAARTFLRAVPGPSSFDDGMLLREMAERFDRAGEAHHATLRELARSRAQLAALSHMADPGFHAGGVGSTRSAIHTTLSNTLEAAVYTIDSREQIGLSATLPHGLPAPAAWPAPCAILECLRTELAGLRREARPIRPILRGAARRILGDQCVLLGRLSGGDRSETIVLIRGAAGRGFDAVDQLGFESLLTGAAAAMRAATDQTRAERTAIETVCALANVIDARDHYTRGHSERVGRLARLAAEALLLPESDVRMIEWAGLLHDVGKIGIAERILGKAGPLTELEYEQVKQHPRLSYEIVRPVSSLAPVLDAILHHHEDFDGGGYPAGLSGEAIPRAARILRVVDSFDAMTSTRPYRDGDSIANAISELQAMAGRSFDPRIVEVFVDMMRAIARDDPDDLRRDFGHVAGLEEFLSTESTAQHAGGKCSTSEACASEPAGDRV